MFYGLIYTGANSNNIYPSDAVESKCSAPTIADGTVSPSGSISTGSSYSVTCSNGFTITGSATVTCTDNNGAAELSALPTCGQGNYYILIFESNRLVVLWLN